MKETRISFPLGTQNACPEGAATFSPGLLGMSYPGFEIQIENNPERVEWFEHADSIEPRWGSKNFFRSSPRVAPFAQPWAELLNPVGIRNLRITKSPRQEALA